MVHVLVHVIFHVTMQIRLWRPQYLHRRRNLEGGNSIKRERKSGHNENEPKTIYSPTYVLPVTTETTDSTKQ